MILKFRGDSLVKIWKIVLAAIAFMIIAEIVNTLEAYATMSYYLDSAYFAVWSKIMMPTAGPPPMEFYYYSFAFSFISGLLFVGIYTIFWKSVPGKTIAKKGLMYGLLIWLVGAIPGYLAMILLINLPIDLLAYWALSGLIVNLLAGIATAKIVK
jgi:hypothetical protein